MIVISDYASLVNQQQSSTLFLSKTTADFTLKSIIEKLEKRIKSLKKKIKPTDYFMKL